MRFFPVVLAGMTALCMTSSLTRADEAEQITSGLAAFKDGAYDKAITHFTEALKQNPKSAHAYTCRAAAYYNQGKYTEVIHNCMMAASLDAKGMEVGYKDATDSFQLMQRGLARLAQKDEDKGFADIDAAVKGNAELGKALAAFFAKNDTKEIPIPAKAESSMILDISMQDLADAYTNAVAADRKYQGKLMVVRGQVDRVEKVEALENKVCLMMESGQVNLFQFNDKEAGQLDKLKRGDEVLVMGTCTGKTRDILVLVSCQIAPAKFPDRIVGVWTDGIMSYEVAKDGKVKIREVGKETGGLTATIKDSVLVVDLYGLTYRVQNLMDDTLVMINITRAEKTGDRVVLKKRSR